MSSKQVLIEWRTDDKWHGVQQKRPRNSIQPEGALQVGQKLKVKFNRHFYDAVAVESWQLDSEKKTQVKDSDSTDDEIPLTQLVAAKKQPAHESEKVSTEKQYYDQYVHQRDETFVRNKRKHRSTAAPNAPEKNQPESMVVLEASKDDRENAAPEKPPRKQVKTAHHITLKERPNLTVSSETNPDDSDGRGACSEKPAPEKTTPNQTRAVQQVNFTEQPYTPQNSISDDDDSRDAGSENKASENTTPDQAKTAQLGILKERPKPILLPNPLSEDDDGHNERPYLPMASKESMLDDSDDEVGSVLGNLFDRPDIQQISQDVITTKDWVESLHGKIDLISTMMSIIETRLDAIETGISVVPLSLQTQAAGNSHSHTVQSSATSQSLPPLPPSVAITTPTPTSMADATSQSNQPSSSMSISNAPSTPIPVTPIHRPCSSTSISPIVSSLPNEKANKLKKIKLKVKSRLQFVRKCMEELFTEDELSSSNTAGNAGKEKLDEYKIGLVYRLVLAAFPLSFNEKQEEVKSEIRDIMNLKCRETKRKLLKHTQQQQNSAET